MSDNLVTTKDVSKAVRDHMPRFYKAMEGKVESEVIEQLSSALGMWKDNPVPGTPFNEDHMQEFFTLLIKLVHERGSVQDQFIPPKE